MNRQWVMRRWRRWVSSIFRTVTRAWAPKKDPLVEIDAVVPWEKFLPERGSRKPDAARKPMDAVLMFKTLVLSALYDLSIDQIEYQIRDRLSFI